MLLVLALLVVCCSAWGQDTLTIASYNIENYFDVTDDTLKNDDDFTSDGYYRWTTGRAKMKALQLRKVLLSIRSISAPQIVGLCEVEGAKATDLLLRLSGMYKLGYDYVCFPTPDERGVATALLYNKYEIDTISTRAIYVSNSELGLATRNITYAKLLWLQEDTLHVLVNHWPSNYSGAGAAAKKRDFVAHRARATVDSIFASDAEAKVVLLGDFNVPANDEVLSKTLCKEDLINLSPLSKEQSYKYQGKWQTIDHIIVSKNMEIDNFHVGNFPFLLEADSRGGKKPFRTYIGMRYNGGVSDHLPVFAEYVKF